MPERTYGAIHLIDEERAAAIVLFVREAKPELDA